MARPALSCDISFLEDFVEFLSKAEQIEASKHMSQLDHLNKEIQSGTLDVKDALKTIYATIEQLCEVFRKSTHPTFGVSIRNKLLPQYVTFETDWDEYMEMSVEERKLLEEKTMALWQGQAARHESIMSCISQELQQRELVDKNRPMRIYFSYAWPIPKHQASESWVQPFLKRLRDELKVGGIRCLMDTEDCGPGENIVRFMNEMDTCSVVVLFGTRSLVAKHKEARHNNIQTELALLSNRRGKGVLPVLMTGTARSSLPIIAGLDKLKPWDPRQFTSYSEFVFGFVGQIWDKMK